MKCSKEDFLHMIGLGSTSCNFNRDKDSHNNRPSRCVVFFEKYINFCSYKSGENNILWRAYKSLLLRDSVTLYVNNKRKCICCRDVRMIFSGLVFGISIALIISALL